MFASVSDESIVGSGNYCRLFSHILGSTDSQMCQSASSRLFQGRAVIGGGSGCLTGRPRLRCGGSPLCSITPPQSRMPRALSMERCSWIFRSLSRRAAVTEHLRVEVVPGEQDPILNVHATKSRYFAVSRPCLLKRRMVTMRCNPRTIPIGNTENLENSLNLVGVL